MHVLWFVLSALYGNHFVVLLLSALFFSVTTISAKILADSVSIFQILFVRSFFAAGVAAVVIRRGKQKYFGEKETYTLLCIRAVFGALALVTATAAAFLLPLIDAAFIFNVYPGLSSYQLSRSQMCVVLLVFTAFLAFLFKIETPTVLSCLGILGCCIGTGLVIRPPFLHGDNDEDWNLTRSVRILVALSSPVCLGVSIIFTRKIGTLASPSSHVLAQNIGTLFICAPFLAASFPKSFTAHFTLAEVGLFAIVILSGIAFHPLMLKGLQTALQTIGAILFLTNMLYSAGFGIVFLSDDFYFGTFVGAALLVLSVVLVTYGRIINKADPETNIEISVDARSPNESAKCIEVVAISSSSILPS